MPITGVSALNAANTAYLSGFDALFGGGQMPGDWRLIAELVTAQAKYLEFDITTSMPRVREWVGDKVFKDLRAYRQLEEIVSQEASIRIPRKDVDYDKTGAVAGRVGRWMSQQDLAYDDIVIAGLLANKTGYDGVSLLNNSHPNVSGTADNLTTAALSRAEYKTGIQSMELVTDEAGSPLGIYPDLLLVGPKQREIALEVTGATRPVHVDNVGAYGTSTSVVSTTTIENVLGGEMRVVVHPRITGNEWFMVDTTKPGVRPMVLWVARAFEAVSLTSMDDLPRFMKDEYHYSIEADAKAIAGAWQTTYGSVTA